MALTLQQALALQQGDQLTFVSESVYTVVQVEPHGQRGVYVSLMREDGFETYATEHDLDVAAVVVQKSDALMQDRVELPVQSQTAVKVKTPSKTASRKRI